MFNKAKHLKNQKGLTLVELLAVIVILAIIAAIAVPSIGNIIDNSRYNAVKADGVNVLNAANLYFVENSSAPSVTVVDLKAAGYLDSAGKIPDAATSIVTKNTGGNTLATGAITYTGSQTVTFSSASIDEINADTQKGSTAGNKTVPATP